MTWQELEEWIKAMPKDEKNRPVWVCQLRANKTGEMEFSLKEVESEQVGIIPDIIRHRDPVHKSGKMEVTSRRKNKAIADDWVIIG